MPWCSSAGAQAALQGLSACRRRVSSWRGREPLSRPPGPTQRRRCQAPAGGGRRRRAVLRQCGQEASCPRFRRGYVQCRSVASTTATHSERPRRSRPAAHVQAGAALRKHVADESEERARDCEEARGALWGKRVGGHGEVSCAKRVARFGTARPRTSRIGSRAHPRIRQLRGRGAGLQPARRHREAGSSGAPWGMVEIQ